MADIVAKVWSDESFKDEFLAHPKEVMQEAGIHGINKDTKINLLQNTDQLKYVVIPPADKQDDYLEPVLDFIKHTLPLPENIGLAFVQNTETVSHVVLPTKPKGVKGTLQASDLRVEAAAGWEAINAYTTANAVAEANAAAVQNVAAATEAAAAAVALVVVGVVI